MITDERRGNILPPLAAITVGWWCHVAWQPCWGSTGSREWCGHPSRRRPLRLGGAREPTRAQTMCSRWKPALLDWTLENYNCQKKIVIEYLLVLIKDVCILWQQLLAYTVSNNPNFLIKHDFILIWRRIIVSTKRNFVNVYFHIFTRLTAKK